MTDDLESAADNARACNGCTDQLDWRDADELTTPSTAEAWAVWLAVVITVAGCLAAVFYPR